MFGLAPVAEVVLGAAVNTTVQTERHPLLSGVDQRDIKLTAAQVLEVGVAMAHLVVPAVPVVPVETRVVMVKLAVMVLVRFAKWVHHRPEQLLRIQLLDHPLTTAAAVVVVWVHRRITLVVDI